MVRAVDIADAMLTLSSPLKYREPFTILPFNGCFAKSKSPAYYAVDLQSVTWQGCMLVRHRPQTQQITKPTFDMKHDDL